MITDIVHFFIFQLFDKAPLFLGIVACIGLALQRKTPGEIIDGVIKTIIGLFILTIGSSTLLGALTPVLTTLNQTLMIKGVLPANEAIFGVAMTHFAHDITLTFLFGFLLHLVLVYLLPFKYFQNVYLTVHMQLYFAAFLIIALPQTLPVSGVSLIALASIFCALYWTLTPALMRMVTERFVTEPMTIGHQQQVGAWCASKIARHCGNVQQDAEKLNLPSFLTVFRDNRVFLACLMPILFLLIGLAVGKQGIGSLSGSTHWIVWLVCQGFLFAAGVSILLFGVNMFTQALVPAFRGLSQRFLPDALPALDAPTLYAYSPTGAMFGFIASVIGALLVTGLSLIFALHVIVFPSPIIMFFDGCSMGVIGNKYGGYKGALLCGFLSSAFAHAGVFLLYPLIGSLYGSGLMFSNIDYTLVWLPLLYVMKACHFMMANF